MTNSPTVHIDLGSSDTFDSVVYRRGLAFFLHFFPEKITKFPTVDGDFSGLDMSNFCAVFPAKMRVPRGRSVFWANFGSKSRASIRVKIQSHLGLSSSLNPFHIIRGCLWFSKVFVRGGIQSHKFLTRGEMAIFNFRLLLVCRLTKSKTPFFTI